MLTPFLLFFDLKMPFSRHGREKGSRELFFFVGPSAFLLTQNVIGASAADTIHAQAAMGVQILRFQQGGGCVGESEFLPYYGDFLVLHNEAPFLMFLIFDI